MKLNPKTFQWIREPEIKSISENGVKIVTEPHTDLWQRTYYLFRNDNAPVLQISTSEKYFSFTVKTDFDSKRRYDQCGVIVYMDGDNWLKASVEYENDKIQRLGSVVTNNGYSDWASCDISANVKSVWFRLSRREKDFCIENSFDGVKYQQMRICHLFNATESVPFGIYACSPENSSFTATFTEMEFTECKWLAHDGQAPDSN